MAAAAPPASPAPATIVSTREDWPIKRATFVDGRLWLLLDTGELSSLAAGARAVVDEPLPEPALELCERAGALVVVTCAKQCSQWTVRRRTGATWTTELTIPAGHESLVALSCSANQTSLLTTRRLIDVSISPARSLDLSRKLDGGVVTVVQPLRGDLFVGIDKGEWGGGLQRISGDGSVARIERKSRDLCDGLLDSDCDPVNALEPAPWNPDCVVVAVGLVHMFSHGRLLEVCGGRVRELVSRPLASAAQGTVAFFGLVRSGDRIWAAGIDGIYELAGGKLVNVHPQPAFETLGSLKVSFELPGLVVVLGEINGRASLSGRTPILVRRDP